LTEPLMAGSVNLSNEKENASLLANMVHQKYQSLENKPIFLRFLIAWSNELILCLFITIWRATQILYCENRWIHFL